MSERQIFFLKTIRDGTTLKDGRVILPGRLGFPSWDSIHEEVVELYQQGYISIKEALCGPLAMKCGEYLIDITPQGLEAIR